MRTAQDRITELTTRQRYDGSSMTIQLISKKGYFDYELYLTMATDEKRMLPWIDWHLFKLKRNTGGQKIQFPSDYADGKMVEATIDKQVVILTGKYNGEDPDELIAQAEKIVGKWSCGKQVRSPMT
jgi:hypothetical protein